MIKLLVKYKWLANEHNQELIKISLMILKMIYKGLFNMGINRDSRHKKRLTGGVMSIHKKKRAFEKGRPMAATKIGDNKIRKIRVRGGNTKLRALKLNVGNFNW